MTDGPATETPPPGAPAPGSARLTGDPTSPRGPAAAPAAPTAADRWLLALFGVWVLLLLVGAFAQVTDNRAILDLFDLHRWFTR